MKAPDKDFMWYLEGESNLLQMNLDYYSEILNILLPINQILNKGIIKNLDRSRSYFFHYKSQVVKAIFLSITSLLRQHFYQSVSNFRYCIDAMIISCFALKKPEEFNNILKEHGDSTSNPENYTKPHTKLSKEIFSAAIKYLEQEEPEVNERFKQLKNMGSAYGSHVFLGNVGFNSRINQQGYQNIFDERTESYCMKVKNLLLIIIEIHFIYLKFLYRNGGTGRYILYDRISEINILEDRFNHIRQEVIKAFDEMKLKKDQT